MQPNKCLSSNVQMPMENHCKNPRQAVQKSTNYGFPVSGGLTSEFCRAYVVQTLSYLLVPQNTAHSARGGNTGTPYTFAHRSRSQRLSYEQPRQFTNRCAGVLQSSSLLPTVSVSRYAQVVAAKKTRQDKGRCLRVRHVRSGNGPAGRT